MLDLRQVHSHMQTLAAGNDKSRREAILALKEYDAAAWAAAPADAVQALVQALQQQLRTELKQAVMRREVVAIFGKMGTRAAPAVPQLLELLQAAKPEANREAAALASQAVQTLGDLGCADQKVRAALLASWSSPQQAPPARVHAALACCKLKIDAPGLVKFLTSTLVGNEVTAVRKSAIEALVLCSKKELDVVPALLTASLKDKDDDVRQIAADGLTKLSVSTEQAMQMCAKQLRDSAYAETALRHGGAPAVPALVDALGTDDTIVQEKAARTLGTMGEVAAPAVPALTRALQAKDLDVRLAVAKSLWNIAKDAQVVVPVLVELLSSKGTAADVSEARRQYLQTVMEALRRIGPAAQAAVPALTAKSREKNRLISESALMTLKAIAPAAAAKAAAR